MGTTVLLVDDDEDVRVTISRMVNQIGFKAKTCASGREALNVLDVEDFDVLLLDLRMPEIDGFSVLKEIKKGEKSVIPIILTAYGDKKSAIQSLKLGAYDFLEKPISRDDLNFALKRALERKKLEEENARLREVEKLNNFFKQLIRAKDLPDLIEKIPNLFYDFFHIEESYLIVLKPEYQTFYFPQPKRQNIEVTKRLSEYYEIKQGFIQEKNIIAESLHPTNEIYAFIALEKNKPFSKRDIETFRFAVHEIEIVWGNRYLIESLKSALEKIKKYHLYAMQTGRFLVLEEMGSHLFREIKEPLLLINRGVKYLRERMKDTVFEKEIRSLSQDAERLSRIIAGLEGLIKAETIRKESVNIGEVINLSYEIVSSVLRENGISFWREGLENAFIKGHPGLLEQVFVALFLNASDAIHQDGEIRVNVQEEDRFIKIDFTNTGVEIPPELKEKLFEPILIGREGKLGRGLAFVQRAIDFHQGDIKVETEKGVGTTFKIVLPKFEGEKE